MKEVITMWKNTRMVILVALSAAIYAAFLIVFKGGIVIVPGLQKSARRMFSRLCLVCCLVPLVPGDQQSAT